ncbi:MAG TPA: hypothetical protein VKW78_19760 [Terriglobales bacterium]|jgi:hypothetical protein|nr:hypothetical protein [Terriglobales bacterium]
MSVEPSHDEDPIEQLLLTAYPNPERKGCPGPDALAKLAVERDTKSDTWYHVRHCSPCFAEFKALRDARWERERVRHQIKRRAWLATAAGITVAAGVGGLAWVVHERDELSNVELAQVTLDLSNETATRGVGHEVTVNLPAIPRKLDAVTIILPRFSDEGNYQVAILKAKSSNEAIALAQANTRRNGNQLSLLVRLDLSKVSRGTYWLGIRLTGRDEVYYHPLPVG